MLMFADGIARVPIVNVSLRHGGRIVFAGRRRRGRGNICLAAKHDDTPQLQTRGCERAQADDVAACPAIIRYINRSWGTVKSWKFLEHSGRAWKHKTSLNPFYDYFVVTVLWIVSTKSTYPSYNVNFAPSALVFASAYFIIILEFSRKFFP